MVVLESQEVAGEYRLSNADLCRTMVFTEMRPELIIEIEDAGDGPAKLPNSGSAVGDP